MIARTARLANLVLAGVLTGNELIVQPAVTEAAVPARAGQLRGEMTALEATRGLVNRSASPPASSSPLW